MIVSSSRARLELGLPVHFEDLMASNHQKTFFSICPEPDSTCASPFYIFPSYAFSILPCQFGLFPIRIPQWGAGL